MMKRKYKGIFLAMILSMCMSFTVRAQEIPDELLDLYAQSAVLMDADSGRILFGKNEDEIRAMASTTKIMTCILVLENMKEEQVVRVSQEASRQPKVHLGLRTGEEYYMKDLLYSLMLESHNDSAVALAEGIAGSVEAFAEMMNQKAKEIDCDSTHFVTPNGLDSTDENGVHSTTASELAKIMRYCIQKSPVSEQFLLITQTDHYEFNNIEGNRHFSVHNHNSLLKMMDGVISGKTGFTNQAGYCYVGALKQDNRTFIIALLGCGWPNNRNYKWKDSQKLLEYGLDNYHYKTLDLHWSEKEIQVRDSAEKSYISIGTKLDENPVKVLKHKDEAVKKQESYVTSLTAPVSANQIIGRVFWTIGNEEVHSENIYTLESSEHNSIYICLKKIFRLWTIDAKKQVC